MELLENRHSAYRYQRSDARHEITGEPTFGMELLENRHSAYRYQRSDARHEITGEPTLGMELLDMYIAMHRLIYNEKLYIYVHAGH